MATYRIQRTVHYSTTVEADSEEAALALAADISEQDMVAFAEDETTAELDEEDDEWID